MLPPNESGTREGWGFVPVRSPTTWQGLLRSENEHHPYVMQSWAEKSIFRNLSFHLEVFVLISIVARKVYPVFFTVLT